MARARLFRVALFLGGWLLGIGTAVGQVPQPLQITFLEVGQGDAVLIRAPEGQVALIDAGPGVDIVPRLRQLGVERIDLLVASHAHADHIGGMVGVIDEIPVRYFMDNGLSYTTATYRRLLETLRRRTDIAYLEAVPRTIALGNVTFEVLPLPEYETDQNNRSVVLLVRYGSFLAFLSGDSERGELSWLVAEGVVPDVTLLKAPHHGSSNGFTLSFLRLARPEVVVIPVGPNSYGHPSPAALSAFGSVADVIFRTDFQGEITVWGYEDGRFEMGRGGVTSATGRGGSGIVVGAPEKSTSSAGSGTTVSAISVRVFADAPGNDNQNTNGEYAVLENHSYGEIAIGGWMLCDIARHCFRFPQGAIVRSGGTVTVYTGRGASDGVSFFMGSSQAVWNNDGDTATVYDSAGAVVTRITYE